MDQLRRYEDTFSPDRLLILVYDDYRRDNPAIVRKILRFLDVDDSVSLAKIETNQSARVRSKNVERALNAVSAGRGPGLSVVKTAVEAITTRRLRRGAKSAISRHIVHAKPRAPDPALMLEIRRRYKPEVEALTEYLDRDLITLWGYNDIA
jgi:hypothetical protein